MLILYHNVGMWKRYLRDWGVSALPILALAMSAMMKLSGNDHPPTREG